MLVLTVTHACFAGGTVVNAAAIETVCLALPMVLIFMLLLVERIVLAKKSLLFLLFLLRLLFNVYAVTSVSFQYCC